MKINIAMLRDPLTMNPLFARRKQEGYGMEEAKGLEGRDV